MWCPCLCQLPNRNSRTGKKFNFFSRINISVQNIGTVGFLHTFAHSILYFVSDEKLKFVFQLMQNSCSDVYGWLQDATLKCAPDLLPRDDDIHARKICSDFDYSSFELTFERIRFVLKSFWFTSLWKYSRNMALNGWECLTWFASQSHNLNKWNHQNQFMSGKTLPLTTDLPFWRIRWKVTICSTTQRTEACWTSLTARRPRSSRLQIPSRSLLFHLLLLILHLLLWLRYYLYFYQ